MEHKFIREWQDAACFAKIPTVSLDDARDAARIIDQTLLPNKLATAVLKTPIDFYEAIRALIVRGAPAIGVTAAFGLYLEAKAAARETAPSGIGESDTPGAYERAFFARLTETAAFINSSRPTAVNLSWALKRTLEAAKRASDPAAAVELMRRECLAIESEDVDSCRAIGEIGLSFLADGMGILTHCNAGRLAAIRYGTATAPIYIGYERGYSFRTYCDETRPLLQGARLTAYELFVSGADVTLLCDNMAASLMSEGKIDAVLVGADRIAANGDTANKIGTSYLALAAKEYGVPFYVCAPVSTIDIACATGKNITVERRDEDEVTKMWFREPITPEGVKVYNPSFDITPARFISAIITERGALKQPFESAIESIFRDARQS